jgi:hypothetical protein
MLPFLFPHAARPTVAVIDGRYVPDCWTASMDYARIREVVEQIGYHQSLESFKTVDHRLNGSHQLEQRYTLSGAKY